MTSIIPASGLPTAPVAAPPASAPTATVPAAPFSSSVAKVPASTTSNDSTTIDGNLPVAAPGRQTKIELDKAMKGLLGADAHATVALDKRSNAATFLDGRFDVQVKPGVGGTGPDRIARTFMSQHGGVFGIEDTENQLKLVGTEADTLGFRHYKYQQMQQGLPVFGQQVIVHVKDETVTSVGGHITPNIPEATPRFAADRAVRVAIDSLPEAPKGDTKLHGTQEQLGWYTLSNGDPRLAYELEVGNGNDKRWQLYVDAQTGKVLDKWSLVHNILDRETKDVKSGAVLHEGDKPSNDKVMNAAHDNAKAVYDFYKEEFGRDSIDNKGMTLKSNVHYGNKYNNAFWNGRDMTYGDGDGKMFIPFALGADVVGHEMTHGVTERSAGLRYFSQSGALNESWSDVFGNLIEKWADTKAGKTERDPTWLIGEEIFTPDIDGDGLRSMSAPGTGYPKDPQPGHMKDYVKTGSDNGGVHINSGIPNKAAYEVAKAVGQDALAKIWFRALTSYLTPSSQFSDAANVTVQAAKDLYGADSTEAKAVVTAWDTVGLKAAVAATN